MMRPSKAIVSLLCLVFAANFLLAADIVVYRVGQAGSWVDDGAGNKVWTPAGGAVAGWTIEYAVDDASDVGVYVNTPINVSIDWGDGNVSNDIVATGWVYHSYGGAATNTLTLTGTATRVQLDTAHLTRILNPMTNFFVTSAYNMCGDCQSLYSVPGNMFGVSATNITQIAYLFEDCDSLTEYPTNIFQNLTSCTDAERIWENNTGITNLYASYFADMSAVQALNRICINATNLVNIEADAFVNNTNATTFANAFQGCTSLDYVPPGLFTNNTKVVAFNSLFQSATKITNCPTMFNAPLCTTFLQTFYDCDFTSVSSNLFETCASATDYYGTFNRCNLVVAYPENLFAGSPLAERFDFAFMGTGTSAIPESLFWSNTNALTFFGTFSGSGDRDIPSALFKSNVNATSFEDVFKSSWITEVPEDLFWYNRKVTSLEGCFESARGLRQIPGNLFASNGVDVACTFQKSFYFIGGYFGVITNVGDGLLDGCTNASSFAQMFITCDKIKTLPDGLLDGPYPQSPSCYAMFSDLHDLEYGFNIFPIDTNLTELRFMFRDTTIMTGELATITLPPSYIGFEVSDSQVSYSSTGGVFTNAPDNLLQLNLNGNNWTSNEVDNVLVDLDTSGATNGIVDVSGDNAAPTLVGATAKTNLVGKSWTVTHN